MNKEIKIEDFIDQDELNNMSKKEREIYEKAFLLNKDKLQKLTNLNNEILNLCPECGEPLIEKWSGVKCSKCDYWDCL